MELRMEIKNKEGVSEYSVNPSEGGYQISSEGKVLSERALPSQVFKDLDDIRRANSPCISKIK